MVEAEGLKPTRLRNFGLPVLSPLGRVAMDWLALLIPPLIWAKADWASPVLKTNRHGLSGALSLVAGGLMFASLRVEDAAFPIVFGASAIASIMTLVVLFWPPRGIRPTRKVR